MQKSLEHVLDDQEARGEEDRALCEQTYGDGLPFDLERIRGRILDAGARILEDMIEIGKYLVWVKVELGHGKFNKFVEADLNMSKQRASEFMRIAQRAVHSPSTRAFLKQTSGNSKYKLLAFLDVSDEEMEESIESESFRGKPLDEIEAMSVRELRESLRQEIDRKTVLLERVEDAERKKLNAQADLEQLQKGVLADTRDELSGIEKNFIASAKALAILQRSLAEFHDRPEALEIVQSEEWERLSTSIRWNLNQNVGAVVHELRVNEEIKDEPFDGKFTVA